MRKLIAGGAVVVLLCSTAACTRNIDPAATNATLVPGTTSLYRFCDETNLIYYSQIEGDNDQFEFFIPGACQPPGPVIAPPPAAPSTSITGGGR
jgi:hypothetical protein